MLQKLCQGTDVHAGFMSNNAPADWQAPRDENARSGQCQAKDAF